MGKHQVGIGMHASLWAAAWTREAAELALPEAYENWPEIIELPFLETDEIDTPHSRKLFEKYGQITLTASPPDHAGHACASTVPQRLMAVPFILKLMGNPESFKDDE